MSNPTPSKTLSYRLPSFTEASNIDWKKVSKDVTSKLEWISMIDTVRQVVEIFDKGLNKVDIEFKTLEDFIL